MDRPEIAMLEDPTAAFRARLLEQLMTFSDPRAGPRDWPAHDLCLVIRDTDGAIVGGLWGRFYYDWLFIALIYVPEDRRGEDLGSALLAMAEAQARAWGGIGVWLDTFSFQAPGFYRKKGFAVFGEIADYPAPHRRFFLSKRLDPTGPRALSHPAIEKVAEPGPDHRAAIMAPLERFNDVRIGGGTWPDAALALAIRAPDGGIQGGLWGHSYYHWLFIDLLVVPDHLRGQGMGTDLLRRAEAEAAARGCVGVWLDTFGFQAPDFYPRHGYTVFGEIADYPAPHRRVFLSRRL
jgi:GNAT superfamily N-acetyltransferase